jgi:hypothetical protein
VASEEDSAVSMEGWLDSSTQYSLVVEWDFWWACSMDFLLGRREL